MNLKLEKGFFHDPFQRVNYLYQIGHEMVSICPTLSQQYGLVLKTVSEKNPSKLDVTMKRSMCSNKKCNVVLVPGITASYRLRKKRGRKGCTKQVIKCKVCGEVKRFLTKQ